MKTDGIVFDGEEEIFAEILGNDLGDEKASIWANGGMSECGRVLWRRQRVTNVDGRRWWAVVGGEGGKGAKNSLERGCSALLFGRSVGRRAWDTLGHQLRLRLRSCQCQLVRPVLLE